MADPGGQRRPRVRPRRLRTGFRAEDEGRPQARGSPPWPRWQGAAEQADPDPGGRAEAETREAALARSSHGPRLPSPRVFISPLPTAPARSPTPAALPRGAQVCGWKGRPGVRLRGETQGRRPALPSPWSWPSPLTGSSPLCPTLGALWVISLHCLRPAQGAGPPGPPGCGETRAPPVFGVCVGPALLGSRTPFSSSPAPSSRPGSSSLAASRSSGISRPRRVRFLRCLRTVLRLLLRRLSLVRLSAHSSPPRRPPSHGTAPEHWGRPLTSCPTAQERGAPRTASSSSVLDASFPDGRAARVSAGSRVIRNGLIRHYVFSKRHQFISVPWFL